MWKAISCSLCSSVTVFRAVEETTWLPVLWLGPLVRQAVGCIQKWCRATNWVPFSGLGEDAALKLKLFVCYFNSSWHAPQISEPIRATGFAVKTFSCACPFLSLNCWAAPLPGVVTRPSDQMGSRRHYTVNGALSQPLTSLGGEKTSAGYFVFQFLQLGGARELLLALAMN